MLGPFRSCMYPRTFRSSRVRKATANRTGTMYASGLITWVIRVIIAKERV
jgi:hypothetical protein